MHAHLHLHLHLLLLLAATASALPALSSRKNDRATSSSYPLSAHHYIIPDSHSASSSPSSSPRLSSFSLRQKDHAFSKAASALLTIIHAVDHQVIQLVTSPAITRDAHISGFPHVSENEVKDACELDFSRLAQHEAWYVHKKIHASIATLCHILSSPDWTKTTPTALKGIRTIDIFSPLFEKNAHGHSDASDRVIDALDLSARHRWGKCVQIHHAAETHSHPPPDDKSLEEQAHGQYVADALHYHCRLIKSLISSKVRDVWAIKNILGLDTGYLKLRLTRQCDHPTLRPKDSQSLAEALFITTHAAAQPDGRLPRVFENVKDVCERAALPTYQVAVWHTFRSPIIFDACDIILQKRPSSGFLGVYMRRDPFGAKISDASISTLRRALVLSAIKIARINALIASTSSKDSLPFELHAAPIRTEASIYFYTLASRFLPQKKGEALAMSFCNSPYYDETVFLANAAVGASLSDIKVDAKFGSLLGVEPFPKKMTLKKDNKYAYIARMVDGTSIATDHSGEPFFPRSGSFLTSLENTLTQASSRVSYKETIRIANAK